MKYKTTESITLIIIQVVIGKNRLKLFFWMCISPGNFPNHGILSEKNKKIPSVVMIRPMIIINFAIKLRAGILQLS